MTKTKSRPEVRCTRCNSTNVQSRGSNKFQCNECVKRGNSKTYFMFPAKRTPTPEKIVESKNAREITTTSTVRIVNEAQLVSQCEIDTDTWLVDKWTCDKKEIPLRGQIQTIYQVKVWLIRKTAEVNARAVIDELVVDAKKFAPKYPTIKYPKREGGLLYEIDMADLHFGKLTWAQETGEDYDIEIATTAARMAFQELLGFAGSMPIKKILLPLGNDFFNVNGAGEFTVNGTRQVEDTRWQKTFSQGRKLLVELIDMCSQVAPVDVLIVPGNHDRERMFYAGDALECWYHSSPSILVDNRAQLRKYYMFGKNLIGFTHGSEEKFTMLPGIMAHEVPDLWGQTTHREWHVGDRHHKETLTQNLVEGKGVTIRMMRSLTPPDEWHYRTGWIGAQQAAESYLWHPENGVIAQFTSIRQ